MKRTKKFRRKGIVLFSILLLVLLVFAVEAKFIKVKVQSDSTQTNAVVATNYIDTRKTSEILTLEAVQNSTKKSIILFTSNWCGSCLGIVNELEIYAHSYPDINFYIADFETNRNLALKLDIGLIPTLVLLENDEIKLIPEIRIDQMENTLSNFNKIGIR